MTSRYGGPIRLSDETDAHLGFVIMAGQGYPLQASKFEGDCVFMALPHDPSLLDTEPYLVLAEHKEAGEHRYELSPTVRTLPSRSLAT